MKSNKAILLLSINLLLSVLTTAGCQIKDNGTPRSPIVVAANQAKMDTTISIAVLIDSLANLPGSFDTNNMGFSNRSSGLFNRFAEKGDTAVRYLVNCLDRASFAKATFKGNRVYIGVMCDEALSYIAYHEATDSSGDINPDWPGYFPPNAGLQELRTAKKAWTDVVHRKLYILINK